MGRGLGSNRGAHDDLVLSLGRLHLGKLLVKGGIDLLYSHVLPFGALYLGSALLPEEALRVQLLLSLRGLHLDRALLSEVAIGLPGVGRRRHLLLLREGRAGLQVDDLLDLLLLVHLHGNDVAVLEAGLRLEGLLRVKAAYVGE